MADRLMRDPDIALLLLFDVSPYPQKREAYILYSHREKPGVCRRIQGMEGVSMVSKAQDPKTFVGIVANPLSKRGSAFFDVLFRTFLQQEHIWLQSEDGLLLAREPHLTIPRNDAHCSLVLRSHIEKDPNQGRCLVHQRPEHGVLFRTLQSITKMGPVEVFLRAEAENVREILKGEGRCFS